jgi:hypothetical protein
MILLVALVILNAFTFVVFSALADHVGKNQPAQALTARGAADQDANEPIVFVAAFLFVDALIVVHIRALPVAKETGDEQAAHALAATNLATGQQTGNVVRISAALPATAIVGCVKRHQGRSLCA